MVNTIIIVKMNEECRHVYTYAGRDPVVVTPCASYNIGKEAISITGRRLVETRDKDGHCTGSFLADRIYIAHSEDEHRQMRSEIFEKGVITNAFAVEVV